MERGCESKAYISTADLYEDEKLVRP